MHIFARARSLLFTALLVALASLGARASAGSCGISAVIPSSGPTTGGYEVVLAISPPPAPITSISWNGQQPQIIDITATSVRLVAPAGVGSVTIGFSYQNGLACTTEDAFTYAQPVIQQISPSVAMPLEFVSVEGANFGPDPDVLFDGAEAATIPKSHSEVLFRVPSGATPGPHEVRVRVGDQFSNSLVLQVVEQVEAHSWIAPDRQTQGGDLLVIRGEGFDQVVAVNIGDTHGTILEASDTQILVETPPGQGTRPRFDLLTEHDSIRITPGFSYDPPVIHGASPDRPLADAPGVLTIYGRNFGEPGAATVSIGGIAATVLAQDHHSIEVMHGALSAGQPQIIVLCDDQASQAFTIEVAAACPGDANGDGVVNFADLNAVLSAFGAACQALVR